MAITLGGHAKANPDGGNSGTSRTTANFNTAPTAGSTIVVGVSWRPDGNYPIDTVTDSAGNTYSAAGSIRTSPDNRRIQIWLAKNVATASPFAVTVSIPGTFGSFFIAVSAAEFKATHLTAPQDLYDGQAQTNPGTGTNAVSTGNIGTPSENGEAVFAMSAADNWPDTYNPGTGYTDLHFMVAGGANAARSEYLIQSTAAAVTATWTTDDANADFANVAITIKVAAAGSPALARQPSPSQVAALVRSPRPIFGWTRSRESGLVIPKHTGRRLVPAFA